MIDLPSQPFGSDAAGAQGVHFAAESLDQAVSAGMMLQHARESAGVPIETLAFLLKVPVNKLEALEMDRHDLLPDTVFARALASSVCRTLKVDPVPVLALLPQSALHAHRQAPLTAQTSFSTYTSEVRSLHRSSVSAPALMAGLLLMAGAAILIFLPVIKEAAINFNTHSFSGKGLLGVITGSPVASPAGDGIGDQVFVAAATSLDVAGKTAVVNKLNDGSVTSTPATLLFAPTTLPSLQLAQSMGSVSVPNGDVSSLAGQRAAADLSADRVVAFSAATQSSWVKVTDAKGAVVLSRTIAPGEAAFAAGALPLSVIVGRADATQVQVRGQAFDLAAHSRDNVARFEVN